MLLVIVGSVIFIACLAYLIIVTWIWIFIEEVLFVKLFALIPIPLVLLIMFIMPWSFIFPKYGNLLYHFLTSL